MKEKNPMREVRIEKVILSAGATGKDLEKAKKLLEMMSGMKAQIIKAGPKQRIPAFNVKPNMELGTRVTLRNEKALDMLRQLLGGIDNQLSEDSIQPNHFSFGIKEYIDIPGTEYQRDIGIRGFNATVVFTRKGIRVKRKKAKKGKYPEKQHITSEEIIKYMEDAFQTEFV